MKGKQNTDVFIIRKSPKMTERDINEKKIIISYMNLQDVTIREFDSRYRGLKPRRAISFCLTDASIFTNV